MLGSVTPPLIVKPNEGSSGDGVFLCRDRAQARRRVLELLEREPSVVVQPFLDLVSEERWIVLDGRPAAALRQGARPTGRDRRGGPRCSTWPRGPPSAPSGWTGPAPSPRHWPGPRPPRWDLRVAAVDLVHGVDGSLQVLEVNSGLSFEHLVRLEPPSGDRPRWPCTTRRSPWPWSTRHPVRSVHSTRSGPAAATEPTSGWVGPAVPADRLTSGWRPTSMAEALDFLHVDLFQAPRPLFRERRRAWPARWPCWPSWAHPQDRIPVVHVAGTAGKGTVAAGIAAALGGPGLDGRAARLAPRLRPARALLGRWPVVPPDEVVDRLDDVLAAAARWPTTRHGPPTFFEVTLAMALVHFVRRGCDVVVLETGLGGRYDATNTVTRADKVAVITRDRPRPRGGAGPHPGGHRRPEGGHPARRAVRPWCCTTAWPRSTTRWWPRRPRPSGADSTWCRPPPPEPGQVAHLVEDLALVRRGGGRAGSAPGS